MDSESTSQGFPSEIWDALKRKTEYVPQRIHLKSQRQVGQGQSRAPRPRQFQVFEILFTELLSLIQPSFSWEVTPLQGDQGIDFRGIKQLFSVPELQISAQLLVCGQCKVRSGKSKIVEALSPDLEKLLYTTRTATEKGSSATLPSYVILAFAAQATPKALEHAANVFLTNHHVPLYLFSLDQISGLIRHHLNDLAPTISRCLPPPVSEKFLLYFSKTHTKNAFNLAVSRIRKPQRVLAGEPFTVSLAVTHPMLATQKLDVLFLPYAGASPSSSPPQLPLSLVVVSPPTITSPGGLKIGGQGWFSQDLDLKLISYATGSTHLGDLTLSLNGQVLRTIALGTVEVADTYTPPFYWQPYLEYWTLFNDWFEQARAGSGKLIACLGSGGAGKTRLCQEFCIRAEQLGGRSISLSHHNGPAQPYRILRDLLVALAPSGAEDNLAPAARVEQALQQINCSLYSEIQISLRYCLDWTQVRNTSSFRVQDIARALHALLIARATEATYVVHLSNLHWCLPEILHTLRQVFVEVNSYLQKQGNAVIVFFEGRAGHKIDLDPWQEDADWTTASFEAFTESNCDLSLKLRPFDQCESEGFLRSILEHSQSSHRKVDLVIIPHQEELIRQVLSAAQGNPQHMVEQLNFLRQKGTIARNERTGLLYMVRPPDGAYEPPPNVLHLIQTRFSYYQDTNPQLTRLIHAIGLIEDRIDRRLFDLLKAQFAPYKSIALLEQTEFILIPENPLGEVAFRHENYFQAVKKQPMLPTDRSKVVDIYLRYVDLFPEKPASLLLLRARAILNDPERPLAEAKQNLLQAHTLAEKGNEDQLSLRILEVLDRLYSLEGTEETDSLRTFQMRQRLAQLTMSVGDRRRSAEILTDALLELEQRGSRRRSLGGTARLNKRVVNSLLAGRMLLADIKLNLFETAESIELLQSSLSVLGSWKGLFPSPSSQMWRTKVRSSILNRLAVAFAIGGRSEDAIATALESVQVARETRDQSLLYSALVDYGNIVAPATLDIGLAALEEAIAIGQFVKHHPQQRLIGQIHFSMLRLVWIFRNHSLKPTERAERYRCILADLAQVFVEARTRGLIQEAGAAALLCGDTAILIGDSTPIEWFLQSINWSFRGNHLENLWRGHINLAQYCIDGPQQNIEEGVHHAEHSLRLLRLLNTRRASPVTTRVAVALAQVARIFMQARDRRGSELLNEYPTLLCFFPNGGEGDISIDPEDSSLDFIQIGRSSYLLY
jgi:hypothetical protein